MALKGLLAHPLPPQESVNPCLSPLREAFHPTAEMVRMTRQEPLTASLNAYCRPHLLFAMQQLKDCLAHQGPNRQSSLHRQISWIPFKTINRVSSFDPFSTPQCWIL